MMDVFIFSFCKVHAEGSDQTMGPGFLELRHLTLCILSMQQQQDQQDHTHSQSIVFFCFQNHFKTYSGEGKLRFAEESKCLHS